MKRHDHHRDTIDEAFDSFLESAFTEYIEKQERFRRKTSVFPRWYIDMDSLTLTFEGNNGEPLVTSFVPVSTYLPEFRKLGLDLGKRCLAHDGERKGGGLAATDRNDSVPDLLNRFLQSIAR